MAKTIRSRKRSKVSDARKSAIMAALANSLGASFNGIPSRHDLESFAATMEKSVWLYVSTYRVANVLAGVELQVLEQGTRQQARGRRAKELRKLLRRMNDDDSQFDILQAIFVHGLLDGEWFLHKAARDSLGQVTELRVLRPQDMHGVPDTSGRRRVKEWIWRDTEEVVLPADDVIHCKNYNPRDSYRGFAPTAPIRRELAWDIEATIYNLAIIKRGMRSGGIFTPKDGNMLSDDQWIALEANMKKHNQGAKNAGVPMFLNAPFDFHADGMNPKDAEQLAGRKFARECIGAPSGAAPIMVGNYDAASYANSESQLSWFWDGVGEPTLRQTFGALNERLVAPDFTDEIEIAVDWEKIKAKLDGQKALVARVKELLSGTIITINEGREMLGMEPIEDGDKLMMQGAFVLMAPDKMETAFAQASNNQPQNAANPADQEGDPESEAPPPDGEKPAQAPAAMPGNPGRPAADKSVNRVAPHIGNGRTAAHFSDSADLLARLRGDAILIRSRVLEFLGSGKNLSNLIHPPFSGDVAAALEDSARKIAETGRDIPRPDARELIRRCAYIREKALNRLSQRITDSQWTEDQAGRARVLEPDVMAAQMFVEMMQEVIRCAKGLAEVALIGAD